MADPTRRSTRFSMRSKQIGQLLLENGDVKAEQVAQALKLQEQRGGLIGQLLQEMQACSTQAVSAALLKQVQVTDVKCEELTVLPEVSALVPVELCEAERLCPFERLGGLLCVIMGNPLNRKAISQIEEKSRLKVKSFKAPWPKISELIQRTYGEIAPPEADAGAPVSEEGAASSGDILTIEEVSMPPPMEAVDAPVEEQQAAPVVIQPAQSRARRPVEAPAAPKIEGIDSLNDANAEMVETTGRGLSRRGRKSQEPEEEEPQPKPVKKAKVNVDLDQLDITGGDVVAVEEEGDEDMVEVAPAAPHVAPQRASTAGMAKLKNAADAYFYADGAAPAERTDELLELLDSLPVAEVVAQSVGEYESMQREKAKPAAPAKPAASAKSAARAIEFDPAPDAPMKAVAISEAEFNKEVGSLVEDPVGEWDWQYAAPGPVTVVAYEEA